MELRFDDGKSEKGKQFYVAIESVEEVEEGNFQIVFDGVKKSDFEKYSESKIRDSYELVTPHLFFIEVKPSFIPTLISFLQSRQYSSRWFLIETNNSKEGLFARVIIDGSSEQQEQSMFVSFIRILPWADSANKRLNTFFSWDKGFYTNPDKIKEILNRINHSNCIHKLNVYDVGQGSLSAVTDEFNKPLFYFDLGGGFGFNKATYPYALQLCFSKTKTVVLSHWDLDHVETARRFLDENPYELNGLILIAPEQTVTSYYHKLVARLVAAGVKLYLWKKSRTPLTIDFWAGKLIRCKGPEKNHNGIALLIESNFNDIIKVLHPGDAAYQYIPGYQNLGLDGLVATHHGANFDINNSPIPKTDFGAIAYSYYKPTRYGHPKADSVSAHFNAGWTNRKDTIGGHISFTKNLQYRYPPRGSKICGLRNFQSF